MRPPTDTFEDLVAIVRRLRTDCPWDRAQTHASIAPLLIEEAYEVKESVHDQDDAGLRGELGDILLHVLMHSIMAAERSAFTFDDVVRGITEKLVQRHPHVFGDVSAEDAESVSRNWEQLKMKEGRDSIFDGMPKAMPALQRAERAQEKAAQVGFDWSHRADVWEKVREEVEEFCVEAESGNDRSGMEEEFGDLLFALVNIARFLDLTPEEALQRTTNKFVRRFQYIERTLRERDTALGDADLETMDALWNEAKSTERSRR